LKADVSWLECKEQCIPAVRKVEATLNIGDETKPSAEVALIEIWRGKISAGSKQLSFRATWSQTEPKRHGSLLFELPGLHA